MPDIFKPETFEFFARFFLAGFILATVRSRYVIGERPATADVVYEAIVLSLLNQLIFQAISAILMWFVVLIGPQATFDWIVSTLTHFSFQIETMLLPALLGIVAGLFLKSGQNLPILRHLAMPIVHPTQRAYDFAFGDITTDRFVIITYFDGTTIYGYFGSNSLASSATDRGDIYIERLYDVIEGIWTPTNPPKSALLMLKDLRTIEFIEPDEEN